MWNLGGNKDMKVEGELLGKRKGFRRMRREIGKSNGGKYDQSTLHAYKEMKSIILYN
jgi:hypothetical protein